MKSKWKEIWNNFEEESSNPDDINGLPKVIYIDAWKTNNPNEEGEVIAKVEVTEDYKIQVHYLDESAKTDEYAQQVIKETIKKIKQEFPMTAIVYDGINKLKEIVEKISNIYKIYEEDTDERIKRVQLQSAEFLGVAFMLEKITGKEYHWTTEDRVQFKIIEVDGVSQVEKEI